MVHSQKNPTLNLKQQRKTDTHRQRDNCLLKAEGRFPRASGLLHIAIRRWILIYFAKIYFGIISPIASLLTRPHLGVACFANGVSGDLGSTCTSLPPHCPPSYYLFFFQYFIERFSLRVAIMPGSAEPSPATISSTEISVIYLPMPVVIAQLQKAVRSFLCLVPCSSMPELACISGD